MPFTICGTEKYALFSCFGIQNMNHSLAN